MTPCIFCQIVNGAEPRHHIWEDDAFVAFLDRRPLNPGHLLIVPKKHESYVYDMEESAYSALFIVARQLEPALRRATNAKRIGLAVEGFGVDHVHLHMIPINHANEMDPNKARIVTEEELQNVGEKIIRALHE